MGTPRFIYQVTKRWETEYLGTCNLIVAYISISISIRTSFPPSLSGTQPSNFASPNSDPSKATYICGLRVCKSFCKTISSRYIPIAKCLSTSLTHHISSWHTDHKPAQAPSLPFQFLEPGGGPERACSVRPSTPIISVANRNITI